MKANHYPGGGVTINLPGLPQGSSYNLSIPPGGGDEASGDLNITASMTITGGGSASSIIDASAIQDRVLRSAGTVSISGVTIRGGKANGGGGGIIDDGPLTLSDVVITGNTAGVGGGIQVSPSATSLTLDKSVVSANIAYSDGGGIYVFSGGGVVTLDQTTIDANKSSGKGGGISDDQVQQVTVSNSTISNNTAAANGGGIVSRKLTMINSTVSGNSAVTDGGGIYGYGSLYSVTVTGNSADSNKDATGNGGGVWAGTGGFQFRNSIIGGNFETHFICHGPGCPIAVIPGDCSGTITSVSHNILTYANTSYCTVNGGVMAVDPKLGPLQANGGPTQTNALLTGSPAIDGGDPAGCTDPLGATLTIDQRGYSRPAGNACDIGAYELGGQAPATPTPTPSPVSTPTPTASATATASPASSTTPTPTPIPSASATPTAHASPTPTHTPSSSRIEGDANCDGYVTTEDAIVILEESEGLTNSCAQTQALHLANDDTNCDGAVTPFDALEVLRHLAGLSELSLPTGCPQVGAPLP